MKKLFYRLSSSRSFANLFSTHAQLENRRRAIMCYRKLISALVFAVFTFYFSGAARAQGCDNPDFCFDFGVPSFDTNITGSSVVCTLQPGGTTPNNVLDIGSGLGTASATFTQTGTGDCTYTPDVGAPTDLGTCAFELTMTGVTTSACTTATHSFNVGALCQDNTLNVTGTLTCPSKGTMLLGIGGMTLNKHNCEAVFPVDSSGLPKGKVLEFTVTTDNSSCTGAYNAISQVKHRECNSGVDSSGNFINATAACISSTGVIRKSTQLAVPTVPFDLNVRQSINTSPCSGGGNLDRGKANIDILGANTFNVANIDLSKQASQKLQCEGAPLVCGTATDLNGDGFLDLPCQVATCPTFGPALGTLPLNPDGTTVAVTCTGQLKSGTQILGTDPSVKIN